MGDIVKPKEQLPVKANELAKFVLIGRQALKAQKAKLKAIDALEVGLARRQAALNDTQDLAEILLYAEAKLGTLLEGLADPTSSRRGTRQLPSGITKKQSHYAQELHRHEDIIAEIISKARQKGEVPIRQQVLRTILERRAKPDTPELPAGKFNVIYADPPWEYRNIGVEGAVADKYPTMTIEKLCLLPIEKILPQNAVLFLWITNPLLAEAMDVISGWGFEYKTNFCWHKKNKKTGIGFYVRGIHEILAVCVRGQMLPKYTPLSLISENATTHSTKPTSLYGLIEKMYPQPVYLEMFARNIEKRPKWVYWGNEVNQS